MAGKTKRMSTIKQLLRLHLQGVSNRKIGEQIGLYKGTVNRYIQKLQVIGRPVEELLDMEDPVLEYELVKNRKIADVAMTAEWELALQKIETSEMNAIAFQKEMEAYAKSITGELLQTSIAKDNSPELVCPKCKKQQLLIRDKIVKCPDEACNWVQFRIVCGVQIGIADIESLVDNGRTSLIKGMKSKAGKTFDAYIALNDKAGSSFEFEKRKKKSFT